jgi:3D (Asp-Asp-Asp) domain-containing protein
VTTYTNQTGDGKLTASKGVNYGPSGKETYYNLNMNGVVATMQGMGIPGQYWVREDGVKMYGDYVMVAADLNTHPRGSLVESSLGTAIVVDTGGFAASNPNQLDIATAW